MRSTGSQKTVVVKRGLALARSLPPLLNFQPRQTARPANFDLIYIVFKGSNKSPLNLIAALALHWYRQEEGLHY